ncbi:MAG: MotA/TolQ/ExbB proton channel family protein [Rhodoferax sp.]|nr:MotA/TolQ/ExbB proton channel family protein [Rhodoferax sp.]MBP9928113.1 MotA/TolQ/ExbB proton channel family protein [Rhodoferax sp.]HQX58508.1 MotA/TolQ/ExbB proton channel family protein [Burkholderiaceae bacterium]HQZ04807.1 MotA/TolQ/ExbB proton channel family protein [Burkholderiaceae bacterium]
MESQFGLASLWEMGDGITRAVVILLLVMSVSSWTVILVKAIDLLRIKRLAARSESFWHSADFAEGLSNLGSARENPFRVLAEEGRDATAHHRATRAQLRDTLDISDWVTRCLRNAVDDTVARMQAGLAVLASVGSTAPFVGLFGTVWGIYHALMSISATGEATIDKVAGPIGEALIMTALGLAVAIPAVLGYNALVRGNKTVIYKLNRFAHDLHAYFITGARVNIDKNGTVVSMKKA